MSARPSLLKHWAFLIATPTCLSACGGRNDHTDAPVEAKMLSARESREVAAQNPNQSDFIDQRSTGQGPAKPETKRNEVTGFQAPPLDLPSWYASAEMVQQGDIFCLPNKPQNSDETDITSATLKALGYKLFSDECFIRAADLSHTQKIKLSNMPSLPSIDAIAVISVYRPKLQDQYIYRTLRSLFQELPQEAQINVIVGNNNDEYVNAETLSENIGPDKARRVNVIRTSAEIHKFFENEQIPVRSKASWNYARALRGYEGSKSLLLFEDDVTVARGSLQHVEAWLSAAPANVFMLFNQKFCNASRNDLSTSNSRLRIHLQDLHWPGEFPTTQATIFSAQVANDAGNYVFSRAHRDYYDYLLGRFFGGIGLEIAYVIPSIAQHFGFATTGLSGPDSLPISKCFEDPFPTRL